LYEVVVYVVGVVDVGRHVIAKHHLFFTLNLYFAGLLVRGALRSPEMNAIFTYANNELTVVHELCHSSIEVENFGCCWIE